MKENDFRFYFDQHQLILTKWQRARSDSYLGQPKQQFLCPIPDPPYHGFMICDAKPFPTGPGHVS